MFGDRQFVAPATPGDVLVSAFDDVTPRSLPDQAVIGKGGSHAVPVVGGPACEITLDHADAWLCHSAQFTPIRRATATMGA